jgi:hypothetical protein
MRGFTVTILAGFGTLYALMVGEWKYAAGLPLLWVAYVVIAARQRQAPPPTGRPR